MNTNYLLLSILALTIGCASSQRTSTDSFTASATQILTDFQHDCAKEHSVLWGRSLCVPMIILDRETSRAVATEPDPEGKFKKTGSLYEGKYSGPEIYANTSFPWGGKPWSMVLWSLPQDKADRTRLLFHEAYHSIQEPLGLLVQKNPINSHLDKENARVLIRLEWNALLKALQEEGGRKSHLANALALRAQRYRLYPKAQVNEQDLEMNEGLAEYTGMKLRGSSDAETIASLADSLKKVPTVSSLTRSSAYYSGPLYGLLLDTKSGNWRKSLTVQKGLGQIAADTFSILLPKNRKNLSSAVLAQYGNDEIVKFEHDRAKDIEARIAKYMGEINQPKRLQVVLKNPMAMFNPYGILSIDEGKAIYTTYELRDVWGTLIAKEGAYLVMDKAGAKVTVSPLLKTEGSSAEGKGWTLKLNPGWHLVSRSDVFKVEAK